MNVRAKASGLSKKFMDVGNYVDPQLVVPHMEARTKEQAIRALVDKIFSTDTTWFEGDVTDDHIFGRVIERESIQTTGLGNGIAFPHARVEECTDLVLAIGTSKTGIDFGSLDAKPCGVICLLVSPERKPYLILQMMASLARLFADRQNVEQIRKYSSSEEIALFIKNSIPTATETILARDLMKPPKKTVFPDTPLEKTTQIMHLYQLETLPVVNEDNVFFGEISCRDIFTYGIPEFFKQLQTVSFIKHLDPFEKYFRVKHGLKVRDLCDESVDTISPDMTLMEIIFEMTTKNKSHLCVIEDDKLIGVINRFSIIDRILFF